MDIKSAFLNVLLDKEIYMEQPEGFINLDHSDKVCLLKKVIYSLKLALGSFNVVFIPYLFGHLLNTYLRRRTRRKVRSENNEQQLNIVGDYSIWFTYQHFLLKPLIQNLNSG